MEDRIKRLNKYLLGWRGYFGFCDTPSILKSQDEWIRRRLRTLYWKQWGSCRTRYKELLKLGVRKDLALTVAASGKGPWRLGNSPVMKRAFTTNYFYELGLARVLK